jgi:ATP-dependent Clp protease ATP-binding subunit ClpB
MSRIVKPRLGFALPVAPNIAQATASDEALTGKISRSGVEAARKRFTPEFMNRLDQIVTFRPLGSEQLRKILDIELNLVQQRIFNAVQDHAFVFTLSDKAKTFLIEEGTDTRYGARQLKRSIERVVGSIDVEPPLHRAVAGGDWILVDLDDNARVLRFIRQAEKLPIQDMARLVDTLITIPPTIESELIHVRKRVKERGS